MPKDRFFKKYQNAIYLLLRGSSKRLGLRLRELLSSLETNGGRMILTAKNSRIIIKIDELLNFALKSQKTQLKSIVEKQLKELFNINKTYFDKFNDDKVNLNQFKDSFVNTDTSTLFDFSDLRGKIVDSIKQAIKKSSVLVDFTKKILDLFIPKSRLSVLETEYTKLGGFNYLQQKDRELNLQMADELQLNYAIYAGTKKDNTRDFCKQRLNLVYSRKEMLSWNKLEWNGKIKGENVLTACGGFGCRHTLNYITEELAKQIGKINTYNLI